MPHTVSAFTCNAQGLAMSEYSSCHTKECTPTTFNHPSKSHGMKRPPSIAVGAWGLGECGLRKPIQSTNAVRIHILVKCRLSLRSGATPQGTNHMNSKVVDILIHGWTQLRPSLGCLSQYQ
eukprot:2948327-Amphidinium_carterae.1